MIKFKLITSGHWKEPKAEASIVGIQGALHLPEIPANSNTMMSLLNHTLHIFQITVLIPESDGGFVKPANNAKAPILGYGTIQITIHNYVLELDDVFYVPSLVNSLFSIKQHIRNLMCTFHWEYNMGCNSDVNCSSSVKG